MHVLNEMLVTVNNLYSLILFSEKKNSAYATGCQWCKNYAYKIYANILTVYSGDKILGFCYSFFLNVYVFHIEHVFGKN